MTHTFDLIIAGGTVVNHDGAGERDIGVLGGRIVGIGALPRSAAAEVVDAAGLHVLPGVIDTQVHFREPGLEHKEDLETGSRAAVMGGVTAVFEMPNTKPLTTNAETLADKVRRARNRMFCDFAFYVGGTRENIDDIPALERLPASAGGIITSGGSMANLVALTAARDHALGSAARTDGLQGGRAPLVLYTSEEAHTSIDKAVSILGIGTRFLRRLPTDEQLRLRLDILAAAVAADRAAGLSPWCVVASAGTVTTGAIDPIEALSRYCREEGLWLHVDGAYGALAALSDRFRGTMAAIGDADSVSLDPHKFLFCAFEAGCVLVRDRARLHHAFSAHPSYLTMSQDDERVDFANYGPQLSRAFKALKVWWSIKHHGADAYARAIDRMHDLAAYMGRQVSARASMELLAPVTFNCVCFRMTALDGAGNRRVLDALLDSGTAFLGPASVKGKTGLRACFMNLRTSEPDVDLILDRLEALAELAGGVHC